MTWKVNTRRLRKGPLGNSSYVIDTNKTIRIIYNVIFFSPLLMTEPVDFRVDPNVLMGLHNVAVQTLPRPPVHNQEDSWHTAKNSLKLSLDRDLKS